MVECRVTFEYEKENDDELTLRVGDIITNVDQQDGGWWEGNLNGIRGVFPNNFVEVIQKSAPPARPPDASRAAKKESESADSSVSILTSGVSQRSQMSNLDDELSSRLLVKVAGAVSHRWQEFGARLSADMFPTKRTDVITDKYREPFLRSQAMLEEWREAMGRRATCDLIVQTLLEMGLRKEACDIFGYDVVELIYPNK